MESVRLETVPTSLLARKTQKQALNQLCDELGKELFDRLRKEAMQPRS